jgi:hypothetical protein
MIMRMVCLANSFRHRGRCLGGILLDSNNNIIVNNGKPRWVRPIGSSGNDEVPLHIAKQINLLDIIEFHTTGDAVINVNHQKENVVISDDVSLSNKGVFSKNGLLSLIDNRSCDLIFGNRGKAVPEENIYKINRSLIFLMINNFEISEIPRHNGGFGTQKRLVFRYRDNNYDLPITDPYFIESYENNKFLLDDTDKIFITISLGAVYEGWCSKIIAGIIVP